MSRTIDRRSGLETTRRGAFSFGGAALAALAFAMPSQASSEASSIAGAPASIFPQLYTRLQTLLAEHDAMEEAEENLRIGWDAINENLPATFTITARDRGWFGSRLQRRQTSWSRLDVMNLTADEGVTFFASSAVIAARAARRAQLKEALADLERRLQEYSDLSDLTDIANKMEANAHETDGLTKRLLDEPPHSLDDVLIKAAVAQRYLPADWIAAEDDNYSLFVVARFMKSLSSTATLAALECTL